MNGIGDHTDHPEPPRILVDLAWYGNARELRVRMSLRERNALRPGSLVLLYDDGVEDILCEVLRVSPDDVNVDLVRVHP